jgi:DNA polymerase-3 subunit epsilon
MDPAELPLAFVDLETTGGTASEDRITEIAIVRLDAGGQTRWSSLVNPETRIPPFIEQLTGISNALVADAPRFAELAPEIAARLEGTLFVAHNARFDYGFLKQSFRRAGMAFRMPVLCTVKLSRRLFPQHRQHGLDQLIVRHGLQVGERHRALGDAQAICDFWQLAAARFGLPSLQDAVRELAARPTLPPHLDPDLLDELPERCGVYLFLGEGDQPLYVGKSKRIRSRVMAHFAADHAAAKEMSISWQVRRVDWIECAGELEALLTEARLVKELLPTLNRQLRHNREYCAWRLVDLGGGNLRPQLVYARDLAFAREAGLYGLFSSSRSAGDQLQALVKKHALCPATLGLEKLPPGRACFARQVGRCHGACVGEESLLQHGIRLMEALGPLKLVPWPFAGPAVLAEGAALHLVDAWCYLGTARREEELAALREAGDAQFDRDTYRILVGQVHRLRAWRCC